MHGRAGLTGHRPAARRRLTFCKDTPSCAKIKTSGRFFHYAAAPKHACNGMVTPMQHAGSRPTPKLSAQHASATLGKRCAKGRYLCSKTRQNATRKATFQSVKSHLSERSPYLFDFQQITNYTKASLRPPPNQSAHVTTALKNIHGNT